MAERRYVLAKTFYVFALHLSILLYVEPVLGRRIGCNSWVSFRELKLHGRAAQPRPAGASRHMYCMSIHHRFSEGTSMTTTDTQPRPPFPPQDIEPPGDESKMDPAPRYAASSYRAAGKLRDRIALVTGGDSGIGRAVALLYAREGADVAIVYLAEEENDARVTADSIKDQGREALLIPGDVRDQAFCASAVETVVARFGRIDILVNNAAFQKHRSGISEISDEQWVRTFETNIFATFYFVRAALPHMPKGSSIINTGSVTGLEGSGGLIDYSATKGAIHAFTKSLAQNAVDRGIRVNCVAPGPVWTPLNPAERSDEDTRCFGSDTPLGRPAQPEEIAPAYVYFASNADSSYVTGHVLALLGGETTAG
jgi:NAD(P)-dependent dehydrogenase (short-subunit alcohol dehydrogenase family)